MAKTKKPKHIAVAGNIGAGNFYRIVIDWLNRIFIICNDQRLDFFPQGLKMEILYDPDQPRFKWSVFIVQRCECCFTSNCANFNFLSGKIMLGNSLVFALRAT